ncbi:Invasin [Yersinia pseudotuberculosis]|nr:Invasin [Yersinia pseudotuberculosis]
MLNYFRAILISWKWKLSHHTSRPHDVKEKGHPRKIKVVAWITLFFQFAFPLSLSFTPAIAAANTTNSAPTSVITPVNASILPPAARATEPYTLGPGDSIQSIAKKYNITVDELKKLNAYRTFSKPFASLTTGDEIEVPRKESSFFSNNPNENNKKDVDDLLARNAMGAGKLLSNDNTSDAASNMARSAVTNEINASSQQWLNQFGTARVQLNVDSDFKLDNSALDLLVPLKDSESSLLFTQLGVRNKDSRNTVNIGAGIRQYQGDWMYGANTFFDNDLTGKNRRVGGGAEVATDYLKFSANTYFGLTGWHQSRDFSSYDERPADGFDIRTEAYLPAYPQLGGKLMYEKYRGDEVALFGKDDRQKDPHAVTLGVNYTPVPLVTIGAEHREGKGNNNNTSVNVQLNYRMGQPWNDQIDQSAVAANRTLAGSRYDLVERNNNIVLDYKKQELIHLVLPDRISGSGGGAITLTAQVRAKYGFSRIEWDATPLENAGGSTSPLTQSSLSVTLPFYQHILRTSNTHTISAVAYDAQGNASNRAVTSIEVTRPETMVISHLATTVDNATANGIAANTVQATVTDGDGQPIIGQIINFAVNTQATLSTTEARTGANGIASTTLTHTVAGVSAVSATLGSSSRSVNTTFVADESTAEITAANLTVTTNDSVANGSDTNAVRAKVTDAYTNAVANQSVIFSASNGATVIDQTVITNAEGIADSTLTNTTAGVSAVTATLGSQSQQVDTTFKPGSTAAISLMKLADRAVADGIDQNEIQVVLRDGTGNAVPNVPMSIQADNGAIVVASTPNTGVDGTINATFTNLRAGESVVSVTSPALVGMTMTMTFSADQRTAVVSTLAAIDNNAKADGTDTNVVRAWVVDANGNSVPGVSVTFDAGNGAVLAQNPVVTDRNGYAENTLTNLAIGTTTVKATTVTDPVGQTVNTHFVAGAVDTITLTVPVNGAVANGVNTNSVQAVVSDSGGNPVTGATVVFSSTNATAQVTTVIGTTGVDGIATATLTNTVAGTSNVVATIGSITNNIDTTFVPGAVATITLTTPVNGAVANGADSNSVQAVVSDSEGNAVAGAAVVFSSANATAQITTVIGTTGADGIATATLTNTVAGTSNVVATIDTVNANIDTAFVAGAVATITLSVLVNDATADGADTNQVDALVQDANGNAITGAAVVFSSANGADIIAPTMNTGVNGVASTLLTHTVAGTSNVIATIDTVNANIDTTFVAGAVATITLSVPVNDATADGADTNQVDALVQDASGNAITGAAVVFSSANGATILSSTVNTGADGIASTTLTHTQSGVSNVVATIDTVNANIDTTFVAGAVATITLSVPVNDATADGADTNQVDALVQDANGNAITGAAVVFSSANGADIIAPTMNTGVNGVASTLLTHTVAGTSNVVATIDTVNANIDTTFVAGAVATITLSVPVNDATADGADTNQVDALVQDANGNAITGAAVVFSSANGATILSSTVNTGADGIASTTLTHTQSGVSNVVATIDTVNANIDTTFVAGAVATITLSVPVNDATADGADTNQVDALVQDANGNAITGAAVVFSSSNATAQITTVIGTTGADGIATATLTNTVAGTSNVVATIGSITNNIDTTFVAGAVATITLTTPVNGAVADGANSNSVQAVVSDSEGNAVAGAAVVFSSANATAQITTVIGTTGADGIATATLTNTVAGTSNVVATIGGITNNIDTAFVAGAVATITLTTLVNGAVANGADSNSGGNVVAGATVVFSSTNTTAQVTKVIGTTGADGIATATLTNTVAGTSNVVATIDTVNANIDTTFVAGAVATITLSVPVNDATADGADTNQVDALVQDANGNVITGAAVVFSSANGATILSSTVNTGADGIASTTLTHTQSGVSNVVATIDTVNANIDTTFVAGAAVVFSSANGADIIAPTMNTGVNGVASTLLTHTQSGVSNVVATIDTVNANIDTAFVAGELENIVVSIINNNALANGADTNIVEAFVTDRFGNGVANQSLMFGTNGASIVGSSTVTTNIDGRVRVSATHTVAGSSNTVFAISGAHQGYTRVTFVADASTAQLMLIPILDNQIADGTAVNRVEGRVTDAYGNPLANQSVSFILDNGAVIEYLSNVSNAAGVVLIRFNNTLAGMTTVTATLDSTGQTETLEMHFVAGKAASIELTMTKDNAVANNIDTNEVQVLVTDADGNAINGAVVNLTSNSGMNITPNSVTTGSDGTATATLTHTLAGSLPINARIDQVSKTINATFIADVSTAQIIASDMFIIVNDQVANGQAVNVVQARVTDSYGNPIQGQLVEFVLSNTGTIQYKLDETSVEGGVMVTFTNTRAGITNVTATVVSSRSSQNVDTTFIADVTTAHIAESDLMVIVDNAVANNSEKNEVHARVTDAKGNVLSGQTVIFTSGNGAAITTVNGISDGDGLTKATLTHTLAGTSVVTARVGNQVQSKDTTFIADRTTATIRASDLTITRSNALADGVDTNAARVIVTDAYGNPVPSMLVSYTSENGATLTPTLGSTDSSGMLSTTFTHTIAGISKVTATIVTMGISQAKDAVFIADRTTAHVSALTVVKNDSLANNSDRNIVQAHIQDAHGNVITGMNVNFSATENVTLAANMVTTNAQGYAENTLRHNAPVTSAVTATVATDLVGLTEDVRFVAGAGARIELFRLNDGAVADGIQTNRVEARVYDVSDNLVPNSNVVFSADNGGQLVQNDALGSAYVTVSNINTGVTKVSVTADGVSASTTTTFIADKDTVTLRADLFLITHDNAVANGVTENRVLLQLLDANDNKVSGVEVNFTATNGASINASAITDTNGLAIGVLTNTLSGPSDVTVTLVTPGGTESLTVTPQFIADINTARIANGDFVIIDDGAVANSVDANEVRARVTDNQGNAIAGYSVTFASQNGATITTSGITGVDGWASAKLTHTKAGESGILARISRPGSMVQVLTPYFIADVSTATLQLFNFNPIPIIADGVMQFFVLGRVFDANQNPVGGQQVAFSATNEVTLTESNGSISTPEGSVLLSVTSTQAGVHPITGTLVSNNYTDTFGATFIANKNTAQLSTLMVVDNNALADGVTRNQVRAHVVDSTGNSVADIAVTFTANHGAQLSHVTVLTDDNGDAVNTLTNSLVGVTVVTAKLGTAGTPLTVDTVFTAGPLATLTLVTMVDNAFADNSATNTVQATLKDATGNPIVGEVVAFAASNGATITATDGGVSNANGIVLATLTNGAAGVSTVTATIETLTATTETTFIAMKNLDVTVGDTTFDGDAGFPTTGFVGAAFKVNSGGDNSLYDWSSSAPALVSVSGEGVVTFNAVFPTGTPAITISATPKGGGSPLSYSFRVNQWFINNNGVALNRADAATYCANAGYTTVSSSQVTNAIVWGMGTRAMGNLWSEWGDFNNYNVPGWEPAEFFWLSDNYNATDGLAASLSHGMLTTMGDPMAMIHVMCTRPI